MTNKEKAQQMIMKLSEWLQTEEVLDNVMSDMQKTHIGDYGKPNTYRFGKCAGSDDVRVGIEINIEVRDD